MKKSILLFAIAMMFNSCAENQPQTKKSVSPFVKGIVVKKRFIKGHLENQKSIIVNEASIFGFASFHASHHSSSHHSSRSSTRSSSHSYSSHSPHSRPSYVRAYMPPRINSNTKFTYSGTSKTSAPIYKATSGKYYPITMNYQHYPNYVKSYGYSHNNMLLMYVLLFHNSNNAEETPSKYFLPQYQLLIVDSLKNAEYVAVSSEFYAKTKKGDVVYFKRFKSVEYEQSDEFK